ncbi:nucleotidyltransferase domain-containing protein [Acinetobacter gyllenbergii]|uniref:nucleotidyltransferase domain-containing protein n=1 Tax=Acinetobacter gyllenbergii TaxID=134534 RepID=UPI0021D18E4E|nr:nucleotidyltransferase domain-containing protein [Acinetobacter gyllenbergii]MCU4580711.1 nucleotidyltransferase domain-containing protein [Acinetobacter gyllenbergii]
MIQKAYQPVLKDLISVFTGEFTTQLDSLYIYGSVAKGKAIVGQSDLDVCVIFKHQIEHLDQKIAEIKASLMAIYPFIVKIDVDVGYLNEVLHEKNKRRWGAWIKFFCTNIYGRDLSCFFQDIEIDRQVIRAINNGYHEEIQAYLDVLEVNDKPQEELIKLKKSLIKRMIRLLPLTLNNIEDWPLSLNDTIEQTILVYPQQKDRLFFLLQELDHPSSVDVLLMNQLTETYIWIEAHLI